uniref:Uncharacterized protein n=1 Tax=Heterorhabditis bacteriophora TaxID=37862 RepID=A0A1I7X757_HETBA
MNRLSRMPKLSMSEYLGWTERRPPLGATTAFDKETISGGPVTHSYENYVKNIFHPMNRLRKVVEQNFMTMLI